MKHLTQEESDKVMSLFDDICAVLGEPPISRILNQLSDQLPKGIDGQTIMSVVNTNVAASIGTAFSQLNAEMVKLINNPSLVSEEVKARIFGGDLDSVN